MDKERLALFTQAMLNATKPLDTAEPIHGHIKFNLVARLIAWRVL